MNDVRGLMHGKNVALFALAAVAALSIVVMLAGTAGATPAQPVSVSAGIAASSPAGMVPTIGSSCGSPCNHYGTCPSGPVNTIDTCVKEGGANSCYTCVLKPVGSTGAEYTVTFSETGLPSGTSWSATLGGSTQSSTGTSIVFSEYDGTYEYSISQPAPYVAKSPTGTVIVSGSNSIVSVTFRPQSCLVGAPSGYCGYSSCPSGYTCVSGPNPAYVSGSSCNIVINHASGYAVGTCHASQGGKTPPQQIQPGSCGYLPSYIANLLSANENWYCPINYYTAQEWSKYLPLALVAVLLAFVIAALIIMVGIASKSDSLRNFGMGEFLEASASAVIVLVFLYVSAVMFGLFPGSLVGPINPYATALHLISSTINSTQGIYNNIFDVYAPAAFYVSMSVSTETIDGSSNLDGIGSAVASSRTISLVKLSKVAFGDAFSGAVGLFLLEPAQVLASMLMDAVALLYAEYFLIVFFAMAAIPAFLIPGVIFRALLPTRALGGILIAMAIGFYMVVPTLFALAYYFTTPQLGTQLSILSATLNQFGSGTGSQTNALTPTSPLSTAMTGIESAMGSYWLLILFYPSLIIAVTYLFVVQVSQIIGGASYGMGRARGFI